MISVWLFFPNQFIYFFNWFFRKKKEKYKNRLQRKEMKKRKKMKGEKRKQTVNKGRRKERKSQKKKDTEVLKLKKVLKS